MKDWEIDMVSLYEFFGMYVNRANERAEYKRVPIQYLELFKHCMQGKGLKYRIRYRGPRNTFADRNRGSNNRASSCLKQNAVHFSAYRSY